MGSGGDTPSRAPKMYLRRSAMIPLIPLLVLCLIVGTCTVSGEADVVRWASTGGGWRSMFACVGFANVFRQAGLLSDDQSRFSAVSTTSGASWFSTQAFYSAEFYKSSVLAPADELYDFVTNWMGTYLAISENVTKHETCNMTDLGEDENEDENIEVIRDVCNILNEYQGDWAAFVKTMLEAASIDYGDDDFVTQIAGAGNRIPPLKRTDLLIQSALSPTSRIRSSNTAVYLGPSDATDGELYSVPISAAFVVTSSESTGFHYGSESKLVASTAPTSPDHSFSDWEDFHLFPGTNGTVQIANTFDATSSGVFREPFGGSDATTVVQVASISSAAAASISGVAPSFFSHVLSEQRHTIENTRRAPALGLFDNAVNDAYQNVLFDNFAVCSQWPNPCGPSDSYFLDGWFVDNPALAINIGHYHASSDADLSTTIKVVLTNTNEKWNTTFQYAQLLQYFGTTFNRQVAPGDFNWAPEHAAPYRSPQIFEDYMDADSLNALLEPVHGSNMTTAVISATTTDNPAFGVRAGQSVEVFLINLNENITTYIVGPAIIEHFTPLLADMTRDIASNKHLLSRVQEFFANTLADDTMSPTAAPDSTQSPLPPIAPAPSETSSGSSVRVLFQLSVGVAVITMMMV